ncbi:hypothetical protein [Burkholderia pseudomultivorans]|uniref:hypothetical protein n=1 Tax=Burkholderia pseudomultivorans TaxID=1207504 RepID=UPI0007C82A8E|nr:hypothetical protein [Burkholderia pseudomultivorans]
MNRYIIAAATTAFFAVAAYWVRFSLFLDQELSTSSTAWSEFGSYVGGVLGPILTFFTLIFMVKTLDSQNKANAALRDDAKENEKTERLKSFSDLLFNMIDSQKSLLERFKIDFPIDGAKITKRGAEAIMKIEAEIGLLRDLGCSDKRITDYIEETDSTDQIFGVVRAFYICVKMISDKLADAKGFSLEVREDYFNTLINFTDFSQLRLIIMGIQFMDCEAARYLRMNSEFVAVLKAAGASLDPY